MGHVGLIPTRISLRSEVPIRVAILHESARHNRYKAVDDFQYFDKDLELGQNPFISIGSNIGSVVQL
jgi:hypothetical protein